MSPTHDGGPHEEGHPTAPTAKRVDSDKRKPVDPESVKTLAAELDRRRDAARRLPPLAYGRRDPLLGRRTDGRST